MAKLDERVKFPHGVSAEWFRRMNNPKYITLYENFMQKPCLHADLTNTGEATSHICNTNWGLLGTNATSTGAAFAAAGGITFTTGTTDNDNIQCVSHTTSGGMLADGTWNTAKQPYMQVNLVTSADITDQHMWFGFGDLIDVTQTTTDALYASQADGWFMSFSTEQLTSTANWVTVSTRASTETETDTGVTVVASTLYRLEFWLDEARNVHYYINGTKVSTADSVVLGAHTDIFPYFGIIAMSTTPVAVTVRNITVSELYG